MARRIWEIDGSSVGALCNGSDHAEALAIAAARCYGERHGCTLEEVRHRAETVQGAGESMPDSLFARCDFVILTLGDGEESARVLMADAMRLERRGMPVLAVVTKPFRGVAEAAARNFGLPDYPFIAIDHPGAASRDDEIADRALHIYRQGMATLTGVYRMTV